MKSTLRSLFFAIATLTALSSAAQQWGNYTLYSVNNSTTTYLIDTNNTTYHTWTHPSNRTSGYSCYLMPGGILWRSYRVTNSTFTGGGMTGGIQKLDWSGNVLFEMSVSSSTENMHHDICPLPNGNVMLIVYELKSASQVTAAGCTSSITMWPEKIVELQPTSTTTATIVWEWHLWDHLCQDDNSNAANYVSSVTANPQLYDINFNPQKDIWHMNGIDYNPVLDQVVVSAHNTNEFYVIDHSTTTAEAAGHTGGRSGKGGDFLYRWGAPDNYGISQADNFNVLHDAHWIPEGVPNAGYLVALNNKGISNTISCIDQVSPPVNGYNYNYTANTAYAPATYTLRTQCTGGTTNMGNSIQFPNGNMMICLAISGVMYEINSAGTTLWTKTASGSVGQARRYDNCYMTTSVQTLPTITTNGTTLTSSPAASYQWYFDTQQIAGATSQSYTPTQSGTYLVRVTDSTGCGIFSYSAIFDFQLTTGFSSIDDPKMLRVFPNPTTGMISLQGEWITAGDFEVSVTDTYGKLISRQQNISQLDLSENAAGMYFITVRTADQKIINRIVSLTK